MSRVERAFLRVALEIGLAEAIASALRDIDRSLVELPSVAAASRYRRRLQDQREGLCAPTLRTSAALVVTLCGAYPARAAVIRRAFADLVEAHPELASFYRQLPQAGPEELAFQKAG